MRFISIILLSASRFYTYLAGLPCRLFIIPLCFDSSKKCILIHREMENSYLLLLSKSYLDDCGVGLWRSVS